MKCNFPRFYPSDYHLIGVSMVSLRDKLLTQFIVSSKCNNIFSKELVPTYVSSYKKSISHHILRGYLYGVDPWMTRVGNQTTGISIFKQTRPTSHLASVPVLVFNDSKSCPTLIFHTLQITFEPLLTVFLYRVEIRTRID